MANDVLKDKIQVIYLLSLFIKLLFIYLFIEIPIKQWQPCFSRLGFQ